MLQKNDDGCGGRPCRRRVSTWSSVKVTDGLTIADRHSIDFAAFSLANGTPNRAGEATEHLCRIAGQVECMPVKSAGCGWRKLKRFASANLKVMPSALLRKAKELISNRLLPSRVQISAAHMNH